MSFANLVLMTASIETEVAVAAHRAQNTNHPGELGRWVMSTHPASVNAGQPPADALAHMSRLPAHRMAAEKPRLDVGFRPVIVDMVRHSRG